MKKPGSFRGLLSVFLTAALVFSFPAVPARAEEAQEPVITSISQCKASATGLEMTLEGTVVYRDEELTVLQDSTGGIPLLLPQDVTAQEEMVFRVSGCRSASGFVAMEWEVRGRAPLPEAEAVLGEVPEHCRVVLRDVTVACGELIRDGLSLPLAAGQPEAVADGSRADVWGVRDQGFFYAQTVTVLEAAEPEQTQPTETLPTETRPIETYPAETALTPVVTATPADGILLEGELAALHCNVADATIYYACSYDGTSFTAEQTYSGGISADRSQTGIFIRARAVTAEGTESALAEFYFTWETAGPETPAQEETASAWSFRFGQLHAHSGISTGTGTPEQIYAKAREEGLDFFAITDYSENFDNSATGSIRQAADSADWQEGRNAAEAATDGSFVGIYGYEMTWEARPKRGHISTFGTEGWQSRLQPEFSQLEAYYEALSSDAGSISQFNHPGETGYGGYGDFEDYGHYSALYDSVIHLIEVSGEDPSADYEKEYIRALDAGWHVAPANGAASHDVLGVGIGEARTVILTKELTRDSLFEAIRAHRVYATEDKDLQIEFYADGAVMGSVLDREPQQLTAAFRDLSGDRISRVEVISRGGAVLQSRNVETAAGEVAFSLFGGYPYYYLRLTQEDGDTAITAPIWVDATVDAGIGSFTAETDQPSQGRQVQLTVALYNDEPDTFQVTALEFFLNGQVIHRADTVSAVEAYKSYPYTFPFLHDGLGTVEIRATVTGSVGGKACTDSKTCTMVYQAAPEMVSSCDISEVRRGVTGQAYRVTGYVTAGTLNSANSFTGRIYLQDDTGGIAVTDFTDGGIQTGAPLDVTGTLALVDGEPVLRLLDYTLLSGDYYNYTPSTTAIAEAMDYDRNGGALVQIQGMVTSLVRTADGLGVSRFTLRDTAGNVAVVRIDEGIGSGSYGTNRLTNQVAAGRCVRAKGILVRETDGTSVLRVRNCDEVVSVAASSAASTAQADTTNPKTGQGSTFRAPLGAGVPTSLLLAVMGITAMGLWALYGMRKRK